MEVGGGMSGLKARLRRWICFMGVKFICCVESRIESLKISADMLS